ncbi:MAG: bifunctional oligoribonuclease/PAP phosphatase NrnA, partial [Candidatus Scatosoma sp.]
MTDVLRFFKDEERAALTRIAAQLLSAEKIAVVTHMRPDGDAFGCALSLAAALKNAGKNCVICDESEVPSNLSFMKETAWLARELP